jgi:hypothetical protein
MTATSQTARLSPATIDCLATLAGITSTWSVAGVLMAGRVRLHPALYVAVLALGVGAYLLHHAACLSRPPRVRSLRGFLWAPFGRLRRIPEGMPLLAAKRYHYNPSEACSPMVVWAGWWSCRTFTGDPASAEYVFFDRRTRYAVLASDLLPTQ